MSEIDDKLVEALDAIGVHRDVHGYADSIDAGDGLVLHLVPGTELNERNVEAFAALLRQAAAALAEARANHEGALKASMYWHDLYRKECRLRQDDAARYGQQLEDAESELAALRAAVADVMAVPELHDMGCIGSMAPAEHALGVLRHFHTAALAPLPAAPSGKGV